MLPSRQCGHLIGLKPFRALQALTRHLCDKRDSQKGVTPSRPGHVDGKPEITEEREYVPPGGEYRSPIKILKEEFTPVLEGKITSVESVIPRQTDILIIGGGIVGSAAAFFLKSRSINAYDVTIVERDYGYSQASTMLSAGGIRHQFTLPENVQMSMFTTEFLQNIREHLSVLEQDPPAVSFDHQGYLFLTTEERAEFVQECVRMQRELGAKTKFLTKTQLGDQFPWLNLDGIDGGSYGLEGEGWFDPWQLVAALKAKNINNGVRYCEGEVKKLRFRDNPIIVGEGSAMERTLVGVDVDHPDGKTYGCNAAIIINCAGPWAGEIARMAGLGVRPETPVALPVEPRKRYVYVVHCPDGPSLDMPFLIDPSGCYSRREGLGGYYICGSSPESDETEPSIEDLNVDYEFFNNTVWPTLAYRVPAFENLKSKRRLKSAWAGYYDYNTVDQNLIIGPHTHYQNLFFANGMSGHGVQQGLAIGRAVFELINYGEYKTIDLSRFGFNRFEANMPIKELAIV